MIHYRNMVLSQVRVLLVICAALAATVSHATLAQDDLPKVIVTGTNTITNARWSADSKQVLFEFDDVTADTTAAPSTVYDTDSQTLQVKTQWAFLQPWTPAQVTAFAPARHFSGALGLTFRSPDGKKVVYAKTVSPDGTPRLALAYLDSNTSVHFDVDAETALFAQSGMQVVWSADSNSVVVVFNSYADLVRVHYLTSIDSSTVTHIKLTQNLILGSRIYSATWKTRVFDVSGDGSTVALRMLKIDDSSPNGIDETRGNLVLWKPNTPAESTEITTPDALTISAAVFSGSSSDRLAYIGIDGLHIVDTVTKKARFITSEVNSVGYDAASELTSSTLTYFSPDAKWLVVVNNLVNGRLDPRATLYDLSRYNLDASALQSVPICSPDPTTYRIWRIRNANTSSVVFGWTLSNGGLDAQGYGVVPAQTAFPGEVYLSVPTAPDGNNLLVYNNGIVQGDANGSDQQCPTQAVPSVKLRLTSLCSPVPDLFRVWRVRNTNATPVTFNYDVYGTSQKGSGIAPANADTTFITQAIGDNNPNTTRLFVNGAQQDVKAGNPALCP